MRKNGNRTVFLFIIMMSSLAVFMSWPWGLAQAGPTLPPRESPTPRPSDNDDEGGGPSRPIGAYIELQVQPAQIGLWSMVQWQDQAGNWHDVEGWQGILVAGGHQRWWVAAKDFGTGPFRWVVTEGPGKPILTSSPAFSLPVQANETVIVPLLAD